MNLESKLHNLTKEKSVLENNLQEITKEKIKLLNNIKQIKEKDLNVSQQASSEINDIQIKYDKLQAENIENKHALEIMVNIFDNYLHRR